MRPLLLLLLLTSCADVCQRAATLSTTFPERHAACYAPDTLPFQAFDANACRASMSACTPSDRAALNTWFDCLERLPVCTKDTRPQFNEKVLGCASSLGQVTQGCFQP